MALKCVLWDFGDTLVDERFMRQSPPTVPQWGAAWAEVVSGNTAEAWDRGDVDRRQIVAAVAKRLSLSEEETLAHVRWCCSRIRFFELPWQVARRNTLPAALVTANPDLFSDLIVPQYRLDAVFRVIVASWQERTLDKGAMCRTALQRLGGGLEPAEALLIDNRPHNIDAWIAEGGTGYLYRGEDAFRDDLAGELRELARRVEA